MNDLRCLNKLNYALVICLYGPLPPSMAGKYGEFLVT